MSCLKNIDRLQISNTTMMKLLKLYEYKGKDYYYENILKGKVKYYDRILKIQILSLCLLLLISYFLLLKIKYCYASAAKICALSLPKELLIYLRLNLL